MSEGGIILGFAVRGEVRLSWDAKGEGGVIFDFLRGGGANLFWNDSLIFYNKVIKHFEIYPRLVNKQQ